MQKRYTFIILAIVFVTSTSRLASAQITARPTNIEPLSIGSAASPSVFAPDPLDGFPATLAQSATAPAPEFLRANWYDAAQPTPAPAAPTPAHTGVKAMIKGLAYDFVHLPSKENAYWAGIGGGLALAVHPLDDKVAQQVTGNSAADTFFKPGQILGSFPVLFGTSTVAYAYGRIADEPKVSHLGMDLIRAITVATALTHAVKYSTHRERPDGSNHQSFPSGHAADTFAFATALQRHVGWKYSIPGYVFASYVAASRLPSQRHWLSDVVFAAAVGVIAGLTVGSHEREHPAPSITLQTVPGGAAIAYSRVW